MKTTLEYAAICLAALIALGAAFATAAPRESNWRYSRIFHDERNNSRLVTVTRPHWFEEAGARDIRPDRQNRDRDPSAK